MAVRTYIIETEFAKIDNPQSSTTYIVLDDNDPTSVNKVVFKTNNINKEGEIYTVQNGQPAPEQKTCKFKFNSDGQFQFIKNGYGSYYLKVNDGEWTEYTASQTVSVVNGDVIELKSDVKPLTNSTLKFNDYPSGASAAVSWELEGDLIGTLYGDTFPQYGCYQIFKGCSGLTKVPNDMFANYAYVPNHGCEEMFYGCTDLTTAPTLPATILTPNCYNKMFQGCTSLTTAPALQATTLTAYCYDSMFYGCTSLTTAPALPATTLNQYCYSSMFEGCTSLTTAPALPATTAYTYCYNRMFYGCTSLTTAPTVLPATTLQSHCYDSMFYGCTSLISAPTLSATSISYSTYCYSSMFEGCTSLTTAPELPATTIPSNGYRNMFKSCSNLNYVKCLATSGISTTNLSSWLSGVSATGTFVKAASATYSTGASGIPSGWTIEDAA